MAMLFRKVGSVLLAVVLAMAVCVPVIVGPVAAQAAQSDDVFTVYVRVYGQQFAFVDGYDYIDGYGYKVKKFENVSSDDAITVGVASSAPAAVVFRDKNESSSESYKQKNGYSTCNIEGGGTAGLAYVTLTDFEKVFAGSSSSNEVNIEVDLDWSGVSSVVSHRTITSVTHPYLTADNCFEYEFGYGITDVSWVDHSTVDMSVKLPAFTGVGNLEVSYDCFDEGTGDLVTHVIEPSSTKSLSDGGTLVVYRFVDPLRFDGLSAWSIVFGLSDGGCTFSSDSVSLLTGYSEEFEGEFVIPLEPEDGEELTGPPTKFDDPSIEVALPTDPGDPDDPDDPEEPNDPDDSDLLVTGVESEDEVDEDDGSLLITGDNAFRAPAALVCFALLVVFGLCAYRKRFVA